jgi:hypothetical protein
MKQLIFVLLIGLWSGTTMAQPDTRNVLFVGNSLTYFYGMPTTFSQMANAAGDKVYVAQHTIGNTGLVDHMSNPDLYKLIRSRKWDYVVIQPGSYETYGSPAVSVVNRYLSRIADSIYKHSPCAEVILYLISNSPNGFAETHKKDYTQIQGQMLRNIQKLADSARVSIAPAGEIMRTLFLNHQMMLWESPGDIHPNAYGSYAIACAMYNAIFKKRVSGMSIRPLRWAADLDSMKCALIQKISDTVVLDVPRENWRMGQYSPFAFFSVMPFEDNMVSFYNYSLNYDRVEWLFEDGSTTDVLHPSKQLFQQKDEEWIVLRAYKGECYNPFARKILKEEDAVSVGSIANQEFSFHMYPNPATGQVRWNMQTSSPIGSAIVQLADISGRVVKTYQADIRDSIWEGSMDISGIPTGLYTLIIKSNSNPVYYRLLIQ